MASAWGGPFNGQTHRRAIFDALVVGRKPAAILETGTFRGTTTEYFAAKGLPVRTVEGNPRFYGFAKSRLRRFRNVVVALGDSRRLLRHWLAGPDAPFKDQTVFAYLDAHWNADLPLAEELDIIFRNCPQAIVMIDDFAVEDDRDYGFDSYGPNSALVRSYIEPAMSEFRLALFYPSKPGAEETGRRRGCAVLVNETIHGAALQSIQALRRCREA